MDKMTFDNKKMILAFDNSPTKIVKGLTLLQTYLIAGRNLEINPIAVEKILSLGGWKTINYITPNGWSALFYAAHVRAPYKVFQLLVQSKANVNHVAKTFIGGLTTAMSYYLDS